jgi:NAD(P)H-flavin reductase
MIDPYLPQSVKIKKIHAVAKDAALFTLQFVDSAVQRKFAFVQGQFAMVGIPGAGECALDICSPADKASKSMQVTVKRAGFLTKKIVDAKVGDILTWRGPFGNGWPNLEKLAKPNLLLIAGGSGLAPVRGVLEHIFASNFSKDHEVQVYCGSNDMDYLMFQDEMPNWINNNIGLNISIDRLTKSISIAGKQVKKGMITKLLNSSKILTDSTVFLVGPPAMYKPVIDKLKELGIADEDIYFSLERRMHCGVGVCQHCAVNDTYVCKNGPVFNLNDLEKNPDLI